MQDKILRETLSKIIDKERKSKNIDYLVFCDENSIATSTYDNLINAKTNITFYNLTKIIKGLGLNYESFGKILDKNLPESFWNED